MKFYRPIGWFRGDNMHQVSNAVPNTCLSIKVTLSLGLLLVFSNAGVLLSLAVFMQTLYEQE